jgi:Dolichyl-phosphate-mannose-protein mannosyltransferase
VRVRVPPPAIAFRVVKLFHFTAFPSLMSSFPTSDADEIPRHDRWLAFIAFGLALALRALYGAHFRIDSDEPQHLHVVWGWTQGMLPYRDFFDNHTPIFQALCAPLFHLLGVRADILFPMRLAMIPLFALTIWCVWKIAASFFTPRVALWTAVLTAWYPTFFLSSVEFRPDELWALVWLLTLAVLATGRVSPRRMFLAGLLLGFSFCVSMKTSLFAVALILAFAGAFWMRKALGGPRGEPAFALRCAAAFLGGLVILPALVLAFFFAHGAGRQMYYCVIQHNMLSEGRGAKGMLKSALRWLRWFPLIALGGWVIARRPLPRELRVRQAFVFFAAAFYFITLVSFWPIITAEDYLPLYPSIMITAAPLALWIANLVARTLRVPESMMAPLLAALEICMIVFTESPFVDATVDKTGMIADVLKMTDPADFVMDSKGETIYRRRPFYYVLEGLALRRLKRGLLEDVIPQRLVETRAPIAVDRRMPPKGKEFIRANYVPIAYRLRTLGKIVCQNFPQDGSPVRFDVEIPARYTLVTAAGRVAGTLDGKPFEGPRDLASGPHEFVAAHASGRIILVWAQAVERGYSPFAPIKPDVTTEQD